MHPSQGSSWRPRSPGVGGARQHRHAAWLLLLSFLIGAAAVWDGESPQRVPYRTPAPRKVHIVRLKVPGAAVAAAEAAAATAAAAVADEDGEAPAPTRVLMSGPEVQQGATEVAAQTAAVLERSAPRARVLYRYRFALSGFAASGLNDAELAALRADPAVASVEEDRPLRLQTLTTPAFLGLDGGGPQGAGGAWDLLGGGSGGGPAGAADAGEGVVIGLVDTGIAVGAPSFSGEGYGPPPASFKGKCQTGGDSPTSMCNNKVVGCRWFTDGVGGDEFVKTLYPFESISCRDVDGHGSHTASTAAGNFGVQTPYGAISGMAPRARIAVYKACWGGPFGSCTMTDVTAAVDQAVADGVDVLSLSLALDQGTPGAREYLADVSSEAMLGAVAAGVFVAAAGGNYGPDLSTVSNFEPWVATVAAATHSRQLRAAVELGTAGDELFGAGTHLEGAPRAGLVLADAAPAAGVAADEALLCGNNTLLCSAVRGKIVVCDNGGGISIYSKASEVARCGGKGAIVVNTKDTSDTLLEVMHPLPLVHLPFKQRAVVRLYAQQAADGVPTVAAIGPARPFLGMPAPEVTSFSSRGPAPGGAVLKPDVAAPGLNVYAAYSLDAQDDPTEYKLLSGTSMATPHVAGVAALIRQRFPTWSPAAIKSALVTTATTTLLTGPANAVGLPVNATPLDWGGGHINPARALNPGIVFDSGLPEFQRFLCNVRPDLPPAQACKACSERPSACQPRNINLPSISLPTLKEGDPQTLRRWARNVMGVRATFTATVQSQHLKITVDPPSFTLAPNASQHLRITVEALPSASAAGGHVFAAIAWTSDSGGAVARMPVAALSADLEAPATARPRSPKSAQLPFFVTPHFDGALGLEAQGMVPADVAKARVPPAPTRAEFRMQVPPGISLARFALFEQDLPAPALTDLDLFVFWVDPSTGLLVYLGDSSSATATEQVDVAAPEPGEYLVQVALFAKPPNTTTVPCFLHTWLLPDSFEPHGVELPASVEARSGEALRLVAGLGQLNYRPPATGPPGAPGRRYMGRVRYTREDRTIGSTILTTY